MLKIKASRYTKHLIAVITAGLAALLPVTVESAGADELAVGRFSLEGLTGWEVKSFKGFTEYSLAGENDIMFVRAVSRGAASCLIKEISFDPQRYRYLRWSWKVNHTIPGGDETTKSGDDYAARIYVVFTGKYFWQTRAINYIWANHLKRGDSIANAYTSRAMMVAVQSGSNRTGQWLTETRDIYADYKRLFGSTPGQAGAIAIMTDTDDTGDNATAWYGDITLSTEQ